MFNLIQKRRWYFLFSACLVVPGILAMIFSVATIGSPFHLSIDFTGGSLVEFQLEAPVTAEQVRSVVSDAGFDDAVVQIAGTGENQSTVIRLPQVEMAEKQQVLSGLEQAFGKVTELRFESVGPVIGRETTRAAVLAVASASVAMLLFIALAFRKVPNPFRYGVCAVAKMLHDVLVLLGAASILGLVLGWEIDALFLTAVLTVLGFSVQDVIVVFDRIRENIRRHRGEPYETIVNRSLLETLHRSLATQLNAIFIMLAIILFGGTTIRSFMVVMLVGMGVGTYSSLFFAVPLLVVWELDELKGLFRRRQTAAA